MSKKYDFDLFTIGAGSGGVRASRMSAGLGARVAVAEGRFLGGTCVNVGCVPKKLMVYASHFREDFQDAAGFGWSVENPRFDWKTFIARKDAEIQRLNGVYRRLLHGAGVEILEGYARIVAPHTVEVSFASGEVKRFTAEHILIATGGKPIRPEGVPGGERVLVSDDIFSLPEQPKRLVIVGGGYIAVEFACIFHGLGSEVSLVYRGPHFLRGFDDDLRSFLAEEMKKKGIALHFNQKLESIEEEKDGLVCALEHDQLLPADAILYAIGRRPNTDNLGLEKVGVKRGPDGAIVVDDYYRTSAPKIYAIGDVTNRINLTPVALAEGMALAKTLFGQQPTTVDYTDVATAVFSQPPLATVGLSEAKAKDLFAEIDVYTSEFSPLKNTLSQNPERTFMKLIVDRKTDRVLGVHMVGADAPEIIQMAAIALKCGATKAQFDATIGIHPTAAEEFVTMRTPRPEK